MAIPKYNELYASFLRALQDGQEHTVKEVRTAIAQELNLSEEDLNATLSSGRQTIYANRVGWAMTYLKKAGLIESVSHGKYALTMAGKKALPDADKVDNAYLKQFSSFRDFISVTKPMDEKDAAAKEQERSPEEALEDAFGQVNATLASNLMDEVMKISPTEFEKLVVKLLLKMGYGSGIDGAGIVTKASGDGGIDGIIKEDQLGFSSIYIQAKQWASGSTVGKPEIQKFAGALMGLKATKGLFITTAKYSAGAREYAEALHGSTIVLVDGDQLMRLMIRYNLGVSVEHTYEVKRIDSDFFADEL